MDERGLAPSVDEVWARFEAMVATEREGAEPEVDPALRAAVLAGPNEDLVVALAALDEPERAERFAASSTWLDDATLGTAAWTRIVIDQPQGSGARARSGLAWLALAPKGLLLKTLRKRSHRLFADAGHAAQVITDRAAPWTEEVVDKIVAAAGSSDAGAAFAVADVLPSVFAWVAEGVVTRPEGKAWLVVAQQAGAAEVDADPHLLEHELVDSLVVRPPTAYSWEPGPLHQIGFERASTGTIDTLAYADALLAAGSATGERWPVDLASELLDDDAAAARASAFAALANADIGRTTVFTRLDALDRAGRLDPAAAASLGPALGCPTAKWALAACRMVAGAALGGDHAPEARRALASGLGSPHDKVAVAAGAALADQPDPIDAELAAAVVEAHGRLRPDQQVDLAEPLARYLGPVAPADVPVAEAGAGLAAARDEVAGWSSADRAVFGLDAVLVAWEDGTTVPPVELDHRVLPVCADARAVAPVADADALAALFLEVIGSQPSPATFDRLLDGVYRFAGVAPGEELIEELRNRYDQGFADWDGFARGVARLAGCWIDDADLDYWYPAGGLAVGRLLAAAARTRSGVPGPALATATHAGGWIDPRVLADRLAVLLAEDLPAPAGDAFAAALRVAPDPTGALDGCAHPLAPAFARAAADLPPAGGPASEPPAAPKTEADDGGEEQPFEGLRAAAAKVFDVPGLDLDDALRFRAWAVGTDGAEAPFGTGRLDAPGVVSRSAFAEDLPPAGDVLATTVTPYGTAQEILQLADPDLDLTDRSWARLAAVLCGSKGGAASATQVLQQASDDGRLAPQPLAAALTALQASGEPAFARAASFATTEAGRGPGPAETALQLLEHLMLGEWPRSSGAAVDALRAVVLAAGRRPSAACRAELEARAKGSTKTAKQCRAILDVDLPDQPQDATYRAALDARLARAARFGASPAS